MAGRPDGLVDLYHRLLDLQFAMPVIARVTAGDERPAFAALGRWTIDMPVDPLERARAAELTHPSVTIRDIVLTLPMAGFALPEDDIAGRRGEPDRVRILLHRALFVTDPPVGAGRNESHS